MSEFRCLKIKYRRKIDAKLALMRTGRRDRDEVRIYWHEDCRSYHLTSRAAGEPSW